VRERREAPNAQTVVESPDWHREKSRHDPVEQLPPGKKKRRESGRKKKS
jgi:hypothetical protein